MRSVVALFGDTHAGSKHGLCNPGVVLFDEDEFGQVVPYSPELGAVQRWLWKWYEEDLLGAALYAGDDRLIAVHNGDATDGNKHAGGQTGTRLSDQIDIAVANLGPWLHLDNTCALRVILGTEAHNAGEGTTEHEITKRLRAEHEGADIAASYHSLFDVDGVTFDVAHHGPTTGIRVWTEGNALRYYLRSLMLAEILRGQTPATVYVRAHVHTFGWETVRLPVDGEIIESHIVVVPSYSGLTDYARKVTRSTPRLSCGLVLAEIVDGRLTRIRPLWREADLRRRESI